MKHVNPDADKLYRDLSCPTCKRVTRHIFCLSRRRGFLDATVYACMECEHEKEETMHLSRPHATRKR